MLINWKKEGYKEGNEVFIVYSDYVSGTKTFFKGYVLKVGIKNLKVRFKQQNVIFNSKTVRHKGFGLMGCYLTVFQNEEEYIKEKEKFEKAKNIREAIIDKIKTFNLEQLETLNESLDSIKG